MHKHDPHRISDLSTIKVTMVEATDDLLLFAPSLSSLQAMCLCMEQFQFAYGWLTSWEKSELVILNTTSTQTHSISMPMVDASPCPSPSTTQHIPLVQVSVHCRQDNSLLWDLPME